MSNHISDNIDKALKAVDERVKDDIFAPKDTNTSNDASKTEELLNKAFNTEPDKSSNTSSGFLITDDDVDTEDLHTMKDEIFTKKELPHTETVNKPGMYTNLASLPELKIDDVYDVIPDINGKDREQVATELFNEISEYRKNAMINYGMTPEEADHAAATRLVNRGKEINDNYAKKHPIETVMIDKTNLNKVEFTEDERQKLEVARAIRLVAVENTTLNTLKKRKLPPKISKVDFLRSIDAAISTYKVPLPIMGDYAQFTGAQTFQMVTAFGSEDDTLLDNVVKQAQLCYDRFYGSISLKKYNDQHQQILSYSDFINSVPYHDLKMMLYGVYVASTPEDQELTMICGRNTCKKEFTFKMNVKKLVQVNEMDKDIQDKMDNILSHTQSVEYIKKLSEDWKTETMYQSPYTGNIYTIQQPTIAKAIDVFQRIDLKDPRDIMNSVFLMSFNNILFKTHNDETNEDEYVEINYSEEPDAMVNIMREIPEVDLKLLSKPIGKSDYSLPLKIFPKCPHCGNQMENIMELERLVFLKAQDMSAEIL